MGELPDQLYGPIFAYAQVAWSTRSFVLSVRRSKLIPCKMADIEEVAKGYPAAAPKKPVAVKLAKISAEDVSGFKPAYDAHVAERAKEGMPPLALNAKQAQGDPIGSFYKIL